MEFIVNGGGFFWMDRAGRCADGNRMASTFMNRMLRLCKASQLDTQTDWQPNLQLLEQLEARDQHLDLDKGALGT